jgi:Dyp-type peroxidase family
VVAATLRLIRRNFVFVFNQGRITMKEGLELSDIQGLILRGYGRKKFSYYVFIEFEHDRAGKEWLGETCDHITTCQKKPADLEASVNVALTAKGLKKIGLSESVLETFAREFQEGMDTDYRKRILGDMGDSDQSKWELGQRDEPLHALLFLYAADKKKLDELYEQHRSIMERIGGLIERHRHYSYLSKSKNEPFGFRDGIAQPLVKGYNEAPPGQEFDMIAPGEFILGYTNQYDVIPYTAKVPNAIDKQDLLPRLSSDEKDLGKNGTYLVYRKLLQDIDGFDNYFKQHATSDYDAEKLKAKFMGRWPSGAPLVMCPEKDDPEVGTDPARRNSFLYYKDDPDGFSCPQGSHIRRANPRDSLLPSPKESLLVANRHRIIRRGRPYLEAKNQNGKQVDEVGIVFIAINTNIKRQFEFIQQTWVNDQKFDGLYDTKDPVTGDVPSGDQLPGEPLTTMIIPQKPVREVLRGIPRFVQVRGGGYFFLPGIKALRFLAS